MFWRYFSEEAGEISNKSNIKIIIDPLDGSDNFASGLQYYGTSVAVKENNNYIAGYVCNLATAVLNYRDNKNILKSIF